MHNQIINGYSFNYNSDLSGKVEITYIHTGESLWVEGDVLLEFIANWVRSEKIGKLEQATTEEILGIAKNPT